MKYLASFLGVLGLATVVLAAGESVIATQAGAAKTVAGDPR